MEEQPYTEWLLENLAVGERTRLRAGVTSIGRHRSSNIVSTSSFVSRNHAEIIVSKDDQTIQIRDLNSGNGIYINNELHRQTLQQLSDGDRIGIGVLILDDNDIDLNHPVFRVHHAPLRNIPMPRPTPQRPLKVTNEKTTKDATSPNLRSHGLANPSSISPEYVPCTSSKARISIEVTTNVQTIPNEIIKNNNTKVAKLTCSQEEVIILSDSDADVENCENESIFKQNDDMLPKIVAVIGNIVDVGSKPEITCNELINTKSTVPEFHVPIISSVKKEHVRCISANINSIFGKTDCTILDKLKYIHPCVYNDLSGRPITVSSTSVLKPLVDGDYISLDSDEDENQNIRIIENMSETLLSRQPNKSPNLFETSLNSSKENEEIEIESSINKKSAPQASNISNDVDDDYNSYEPQSDDEDVEDLMFSQVIINDMRDELANNSCDKDEEDKIVSIDPSAGIHIKSEPVAESLTAMSTSVKQELNSSTCWEISDDEDFDKELETKVSGWSFRLSINNSSQPRVTMSQIYELENDDIGEGDKFTDFYNCQIDKDEIASVLVESVKNKLTNADDKKETVSEIDNGLASALPPVTSESFSIKDSPIIRYNSLRTRRVVSSSSEDEEVVDNILKEKQKKEHMFELNNVRSRHFSETETKHLKKRRISYISEENHTTPKTGVSESETKNRRKSSICEERPIAAKTRVSQSKTAEHSKKRRQSSASEERLGATISIALQDNQVDNKQNKKTLQFEEEFKPKHRNLPLVIDAPPLPKHKGKLRGVSAVPHPLHSPSTSTKLLARKYAETKERIKHESIVNDLKRKWLEKPSEAKRRNSKEIQDIRESRKERLKELADKQSKSKKVESHKKKNTGDLESMKKLKVKLTTENRGTFLAKDIEMDYKIPKISKSKNSNYLNPKCDIPQSSFNTITKNTSHIDDNPFQSTIVSSTTNCDSKITTTSSAFRNGQSTKVNRSMSADYIETFSQQISKPDQLLLQRHHSSSNTTPPNPIRAQRIRNKMTFASMEKNFVESHQNQKKLAQISNKRSCISSSSHIEINPQTESGKRPKKTVRFNDTPTVYYIERVNGADKKVDVKDIVPLSTYSARRRNIRETYKLIDKTSEIITQILNWSNDWLCNRNAQVNAVNDTVLPMPNNFNSFDNYKSTIFRLMKLEYSSSLEREYNANRSRSSYKVSLEYVTEVSDRVILVTKFNIQNKSDVPKCDLVVLNFGSNTYETFAYMSTHRKGTGIYKMVFEILKNIYPEKYLQSVQELSVRPAMENVRVEFGVLNAVYQLEQTPLFNVILEPFNLLTSNPPPSRRTINSKACDPLNEEQKRIMIETYFKTLDENTPDITLIQGPPGTGKSHVITNLALQLTYGNEVRAKDKKILICAQSNGAVDIITEKLYKISRNMRPDTMFNLVRFGMLNKINANVMPVSLQKYIERHQMTKLKSFDHDIQVGDKDNLRKEMEHLEKEIAYMKLQNIEGTVQEDELIKKKKSLQIMRYLFNGSILPEDEFYLKKWYLSNAQIVCTTLSSCVNLSQYINYFDVCIIDEATQCTEPWTLLPLKFGMKSLVLVGDTQQLPATVISKKAAELGLGTSLFTRIQRCLSAAATNSAISDNDFNKNIFSLQTQYRMHPEICKWPNAYFYGNKLINAPQTLHSASCIMPFSILNLTYTQNDNCENGQIANNLEADFVAKLLKSLGKYIPMERNTYGVITPYMQQRNALIAVVKTAGLKNIMVHTIDSYQGIEKDVIVISNARTTGIGFLYNCQRLNVALTRSRKCLILCGNFKNLEAVPAWSSLLSSARQRNLFHEINANCIDDMEKYVIDKIRVPRPAVDNIKNIHNVL